MVGKETTIAIVIGLLLIVVGVLGRFMTGTTSITALIPAFFGIPMLILGLVGLNPARLKMSMHIVAVLALLGVLGTFSILVDVVGVAMGTSALSGSILSRGAMFVLSLIMLIVSIMSFIQVRRNRRMAASQ